MSKDTWNWQPYVKGKFEYGRGEYHIKAKDGNTYYQCFLGDETCRNPFYFSPLLDSRRYKIHESEVLEICDFGKKKDTSEFIEFAEDDNFSLPNSSVSIDKDELRQKLKEYNWSSDKDYQLAIIAFRELVPAQQNTLLDKLEDQKIAVQVIKPKGTGMGADTRTEYNIPISAIHKLRRELTKEMK